MRIGIFTDAYEPHVSGVTTSINMLKRALELMGHEVFIVTANLKDNKFVYDEEGRIISLPGMKTGIYQTKITSIYSKKAMDIIRGWSLDIIHSQSEFGVGLFSKIVAKKLDLPVVHTYHTLYEDYVHYVTKGYFDNFAKKVVVKFTRYFCDKKCDELIVPTDKIKDLFINKYDIKREINVIPTGIDTVKFMMSDSILKNVNKLKRKYKIKNNDFVIGAVGRIAKEKSFDKLIKTMKKLVKINEAFKLFIVGDGPEVDNLKELTKSLNLEDNVVFTGKVDYELIPSYYNMFDVMTSFSTTETQGLTIIEALAASTPVVAVNDESFREMVQDKYNGFLFNESEEFIDLILDLKSDKKLYETMKINARNSVYKYSKEVFASDILKVYSKAIAKKTKRV